jgi:ribosomal protein S27AE
MNALKHDCYALIQEIVCKRDKVCQRCGRNPISAHHVFGRKNHGSAFEPDSCLALCAECHDGWARKCPQEAKDLLRTRFGEERYTYLAFSSREVCRLRDSHFRQIRERLTALAKEIQCTR